MLEIMPPPTTSMLCPMQNEKTSTHALTRREDDTRTFSTRYRSTHKNCRKNDRRHDSCGSNLPVTYIEPRIHFPQNSRTSRSEATGTEHPNNFHKQTLRLSHCDEHGPKPTWWHTSSCFNAGIYPTVRINAGRTKLRGDLIVTALDQRQPTWCILALQ